jgi:DNA-binding CsgD family transcriptional regulator
MLLSINTVTLNGNKVLVQAGSNETLVAKDYETLKTIAHDETKAEYQLVTGTIHFPTAIDLTRDIRFEAVGAPAVFIFDNTIEYPRNTKVAGDLIDQDGNYVWSAKDYDRHFVMWTKDHTKRLSVSFANIIFRSSSGIGGLSVPNGGVNLLIENCVFEGLGEDGFINGAAIHCTEYSNSLYNALPSPDSRNIMAFTLEIRRTIFIRNRALVAAVFTAKVPSGAGFPRARYQDCRFLNNYYSDAFGGSAIYSEAIPSLAFIDTIESICDDLETAQIETVNQEFVIRKNDQQVHGWKDREGNIIELNKGQVSLSQGVFPIWRPINQGGLEPWAVALIIVFGITILGAGSFFIAFRLKKQKQMKTLVSEASVSEIMIQSEVLEDVTTKYHLTAREKEILLLIVTGKTQVAIAKELFISLATVKTHTANIYSKLGINSRFELFAKLSSTK